MMAYHQRVPFYKPRIDFEDPATTKPPSLAKSAVLQALEEEERHQGRNKDWQRPGRSRQRSRTPCIDRETVLRINRRPQRHRSCDNFWPPARGPLPLDTRVPAVGGTEVPAGNGSPEPASPYRRWVHFDNGNISPTTGGGRPSTVRVPTPFPSPISDCEILDKFAGGAMEIDPSNRSDPRAPDLVENVPLIDAVLDDLLTFSKNLVLRQSSASSALAAEREEAKIVEINDDDLINLLADDDNSETRVVDGPTEEPNEGGENAASGKSLPSKQDRNAAEGQENSGDESFREAECDRNANEQNENPNYPIGDSEDVLDNYLSTRRNQEDIFANVAIFNWNPMDVYHQHGLFMIDPRFALADLHAIVPTANVATSHHRGGNEGQYQGSSHNEPTSRTSNGNQKSNVAHLNSLKREQASNDEHPSRAEEEDDADDTAATIGIVKITDGADTSSEDVNSFATQRRTQDDTVSSSALLESHKIPNDRTSPAVDHFYDSAHVEYPVVRPDLYFGTATSQRASECHQSPLESDYDNDPPKSSSSVNGDEDSARPPTTADEQEEGLKRVAWPPPAESGDDYEQHPSQNKCPPQVQQQQQQHYQQASPQPHPHQQQQQHQPRERIIPIQRATSHISPHQTPKSPVNQLKYPSYPPASPQNLSTPQYPAQQRRTVSPLGGSSTVAFSGGRAVVPQQPQQPQQQHQFQPARPVSAPHYQQQQQQQQKRYSSPSTASLASPRSPQIIGGGHSPRGWAHVQSPVPVYRPAPRQQQQQQQQQPYVPPPFQTEPTPYQPSSAGYGYGYGPRKPEPSSQQPQYQPQATQAFQPPVTQQQQHQPYYQPDQIPFVTTLRKEPPMSQEPAPVYQAQPVAAIYQGGTNMRGDQKWPPAEYKAQSELENEERRRLAHQPAFRPRKAQKDYTSFFAKHALNQTYPSYRAPPGTQHHC
ncbi:bromodomain-containing protein DDB_G0280777 isoform X2 [Toxorhynchites rutilus septentrionalis]|uniref:bromodomain-containing protein DDB_G0280777 isoform X2 n=1 Tax=Toxorhynchites rutilus septentrionalis TaxID=329112 RepID=UPI002479CAF5|nr:bromodomain-containing protein DDB_G0280777 isoform X2 [Toxorhynchites rutilus septentrionalis]